MRFRFPAPLRARRLRVQERLSREPVRRRVCRPSMRAAALDCVHGLARLSLPPRRKADRGFLQRGGVYLRAAPETITEGVLNDLGGLPRLYHEAVAGFELPSGVRWYHEPVSG